MIAASIRFPAGRYHATPWNRQVNEGEVEWPPSPWRLLRALVATWHRKGTDLSDRDKLVELVEALADTPPRFALPDATPAHTRHFMPVGKERYKSGKGNLLIEDTSLVFDAFLDVPKDAPMIVAWPDVEFETPKRRLLGGLLERMSYLGRAESWTEARLLKPDEVADLEFNAVPADANGENGRGATEDVDRMAPISPSEYPEWRDEQRDRHAERILAEKRRKGQNEKITSANRRNIEESVPETFFDALTCDTSLLDEYGWNQPPGSRWVQYERPPYQTSSAAGTPMRTSSESDPTVARFKVHSNAVPRMTDGIAVAEKVRLALLSNSDGHRVFAGRDDDGEPLTGHQHSHVIFESTDGTGNVSHVTLYAPMGFDIDAQRAISKTTTVWANDGPVEFELQLVLLGMGRAEDFAGRNRKAGQCPALCESKFWISRTPFVPTRHEKDKKSGPHGYNVGSPPHDLLRLLDNRGNPEVTEIRALRDLHSEGAGTVDLHTADGRVEPIAGTRLGAKPVRWLDFRTIRPDRDRGQRSTSRGYGFEIEFAEPVRGPICAGYGAHYGLGRFEPAGDANPGA